MLDRTKEPGALGEPLYLDVVTALREAKDDGISPLRHEPLVVGGRYGLSSKEFTPGAWSRRSSTNLCEAEAEEPLHGRHRGRRDAPLAAGATPTSTSSPTTSCARVFFGLGADGTVGANKNSIKIIGEETDNYAQGYFVYDSKKSGAVTISHLRFGPRPIRSSVPGEEGQLRGLPPVTSSSTSTTSSRMPAPARCSS